VEIIVHTRNANLASDFKSIVTDKLKTLDRFNVKIDSIKVEVSHEQNPRFGKSSHEVILTTHGAGPFIRAEANSFNDVAAFDDAVNSFEQQLRKIHEKSKEHSRESIKNLS